MTARRRTAVAISALAALGTLAACGGSPTPAPSRSTTSSASTATSAPSSSSPSTTTSPAPPLTARTVAELKKALLSIEDVPSGFAVDPPSRDSGGLGASSKDPRCATFVKLSNSSKAPGSTATVDVSFSGGQDGPAVEESLDAMGSAARVAALQASFKASIAACRTVNVAVPGAGPSVLTVQAVKPPAHGMNPLAARLTVAAGPLKGMQFTIVTTGIGDTVLSMTFVGEPPGDVEAATSLAVEKATLSLGVTPGT